jgi:hypothetical protein
VDFDFQVFDFVSVDESNLKRIKCEAEKIHFCNSEADKCLKELKDVELSEKIKQELKEKIKQELKEKIKKVSEKIEILRKKFLGNLTVGDASQFVISHKKKQDSMHCLQVNLHKQTHAQTHIHTHTHTHTHTHAHAHRHTHTHLHTHTHTQFPLTYCSRCAHCPLPIAHCPVPSRTCAAGDGDGFWDSDERPLRHEETLSGRPSSLGQPSPTSSTKGMGTRVTASHASDMVPFPLSARRSHWV